MAARVSDTEVKEIIDTTVTTTAFITAANLLVNNVLSDAGHSEELLKEIERWLLIWWRVVTQERNPQK